MSGMFIEVNMKAIFVVISCSENKALKKKKKKKKKKACAEFEAMTSAISVQCSWQSFTNDP